MESWFLKVSDLHWLDWRWEIGRETKKLKHANWLLFFLEWELIQHLPKPLLLFQHQHLIICFNCDLLTWWRLLLINLIYETLTRKKKKKKNSTWKLLICYEGSPFYKLVIDFVCIVILDVYSPNSKIDCFPLPFFQPKTQKMLVSESKGNVNLLLGNEYSYVAC